LIEFNYTSPMMLDPGDSITINHFANGLTPGWHAHHLLILWLFRRRSVICHATIVFQGRF
jgi:hypothetical protein